MKQKSYYYLITLVVLCLLALPAFATDITADGFGTTKEEAKANANANLSSYLNSAFVESSTSVSRTETQDSEGYSLSASSTTTTVGFLRAVTYTESMDANGYCCVATIKDTDTNRALFLDGAKTQVSTVNTLHSRLSKQQDAVKKNTLISLYSALMEYEFNKTVLIYMGYSDLVPALEVSITATSVFTEYENIILAEGYALEEREKNITDEAERQKLLEELSANRKERRRIEKEKNEATKSQEEATRKMLEERLKQSHIMVGSSYTPLSTNSERYTKLLEDIDSTRKNFLSACEEYNKISLDQFTELDNDFQAEKEAVENRPYRFAELQGIDPTPEAKAIRDREIRYLYNAKEMHKVAIFRQIRESLVSPVEKRYQNYVEAVEAIKGETFEFVLHQADFKTLSTSFDAANTTWTITARLTDVPGINEPLTVKLSYKELTGKDVQTAKFKGEPGYESYMEFMDDVDYLEELMHDYSSYFSTVIHFTVDVEKNASGIGYKKLFVRNIQVKIESNAVVGNETLAIQKTATPNKIAQTKDLSWTLPGYAKSFNKEFLK